MGATIPEPPKDDKSSIETQQYLKTIYEELKRDNAETGLKLPSGAVFFMLTGGCPSGSTDVTTTYSDKFLRINTTQGTTGGADTVAISEANLPSHTHPAGTLTIADEAAHTHTAGFASSGSASNVVLLGAGFTSGGAQPQTGAGTAHTHTISGSGGATGSGTAVTITNPYLTCKMCQVN